MQRLLIYIIALFRRYTNLEADKTYVIRNLILIQYVLLLKFVTGLYEALVLTVKIALSCQVCDKL
jgi:hypothetical protein